MDPLTTLAIAVGLAMDAFGASLAAGVALGRLTPRQTFRLAWHFGLFQFGMPVLGWAAGLTARKWMEAFDHWVAFGLLALVGAHMIWGAVHGSEQRASRSDPTRGLTLIVLSVATSIDALAVGLSFAALRVSVWIPAAIIGGVCSAMTLVGASLGERASRSSLGRRAGVVGGVILIGIGVRILIGHLSA